MQIQISRLSRWLLILSVGLIVGTLLLIQPLFAQEKSVVWERFDIDIDVNQDSSFNVMEAQEIRFLQGEFTFGTRYIPIVNFDSLDNWSLTDGKGNVYTQNETGAPYTFSVDDNGYQYDIRWNFPPIANDVETYYLSYTVNGGLRFYEGGDQVWWKAIYGDRSFPVLEGTVNVNVPSPATIDEYAAYSNGADARDSATATLADDRSNVAFSLTRTLQAGQDFEVRVQFTDGVIAGAPAAWQQRADEEAAQREADQAFYDFWGPVSTLFFGAIGFLLLLGGPAVLYALWYRFGRDKPVEMVADYLPEPPDSLAPGVAGTLLDEQADMEDIIATLVDLARRKAISITEDKQEGFFRSGTEFIYRRERDDVPLSTYEQKLLDGMFKNERMVQLSDLKEKFYSKLPGIKTALYDAAIEEGLFPRNPATVRRVYQILGVIGLIGSFWVAMIMRIAFSSLTGAAVLPGIGLGATALGLIILSRHMPRKTDKGAEAAARWQAFKNYLKDIDQYADMESQKALWDQWLPYAIAFGVDKQYIRSFESVDAPAPGWYIPSPTLYGPMRPWYYGTPGGGPISTGGGGLGDVMTGPSGQGGSMGGGLSQASRGMGASLAGMSVGLGSMLTSASSTMTSRPASSSSGGGWSSGGGGFSGGGSFGGGGGGGGGGGFG